MVQEKVLFVSDFVRISDKRAVFGTTTYALPNITSVGSKAVAPNRRPVYFCIFISLLLGAIAFCLWPTALMGVPLREYMPLIVAIIFSILSFGLLLAAIFFFIRAKTTYAVVLMTSGVESRAFVSQDWPTIRDIVTALNNAMAMRN